MQPHLFLAALLRPSSARVRGKTKDFNMLPKSAPKSILKKTNTRPPTRPREDVSSDNTASFNPVTNRHMATALHHAKLIQQQKDTEKLILDASLCLLDLPSSPSADPAVPVAEDIRLFKENVALLRPQDYNDLVEERNASRLCGYALCSRPNKRLKGDAKFKLVISKEAGLKSVSKSELERWCSTDCARRALYVKVQLLEEPGGPSLLGRSADVDLLAEETPMLPIALPLRPKLANYEIQIPSSNANAQRASGTATNDSSRTQTTLLTSQIVEKRVIKAVSAPSLESSGQSHSAIEGYAPTELTSVRHEQASEEDLDWDD